MESSFQQYFGTNYVPPIEERTQIQAIITHSYQTIREIDTEIDELQQKLELLQDQRSKMDDFYEQHLALLSPARNLTEDILQAIFIACLPEDRNPCMSNKDIPMLLTQICSSWRRIALSTPRLWAAIHVVLPNIHVDSSHPHDALELQEELVNYTLNLRETAVKKWLDKSGACPLSISIYQSIGWGPNQLAAHTFRNSHISFIKNAIAPYNRRCYELDIHVARDTLERFQETGLLKSSDTTRKVHITTRPSSSFQFTIERLDNQWKNAISLIPPHPVSVTLQDIHILPSDARSTALRPRWEQLTQLSLHLSWDSSDDILDFSASILCQCKTLRTLNLILLNGFPVNNSWHHSGRHTDDIVLSHLETLRIALPGTAKSVELTKRLYLPEIKWLDLEFGGIIFEVGEEILTSLLRVSGNLQSLRLYQPHWLKSPTEIIQLIQATPSLKSLYLFAGPLVTNRWEQSLSAPQPHFSSVLNDDFLSALTPHEKDSSSIICPNLEELECHLNLLTGFTERGLKEFIKARRNDHRVKALRRISVFVNRVKTTGDSEDEKVPLGKDSTVYFRAPEKQDFLSPWMGIGERSSKEEYLPFEAYTEL